MLFNMSDQLPSSFTFLYIQYVSWFDLGKEVIGLLLQDSGDVRVATELSNHVRDHPCPYPVMKYRLHLLSSLMPLFQFFYINL